MTHHLGDFSEKSFHDAPLPVREDVQGGLKEYSVVYTDRAINHMSPKFMKTMRNLDAVLKRAYNAGRRHHPGKRDVWDGIGGETVVFGEKSVGDSKWVLFVSVDGYF